MKIMLVYELGVSLEKLYKLTEAHCRSISLFGCRAQREYTAVFISPENVLQHSKGNDEIPSMSKSHTHYVTEVVHRSSFSKQNGAEMEVLQNMKEEEGKIVVSMCESAMNDVTLVLQKFLQRPVSWGSFVEEELIRIKCGEYEPHICFSHQIPLLKHFVCLQSALNNATSFTIIDLSSCFMGDDNVEKMLKLLAHAQQLRILILDCNGITVRLVPLFIRLLHPDNAQRQVIATLPSLRWLSLSGNPITSALEELRSIWRARLSLRTRPLTICRAKHLIHCSEGRKEKKIEQRNIRVIVLQGAGMGAFILALALRKHNREIVSYESIWKNTNMFCAVSFATIIAAAMALRLPTDQIIACFLSIAERVFTVSSIRMPYRMVSAWWYGNGYYSSFTLSTILRELFGPTCDLTLAEIESQTGKKLLFFAAELTKTSYDSKQLWMPKCVVMRSWSRTTPHSMHNESFSGSTLLETLLACCCAPDMVGPVKTWEGKTVRDIFFVPTRHLVSECLETMDDASHIHLEFWIPTSAKTEDGTQIPVSLLRNPLLLQEVTSCFSGALLTSASYVAVIWQQNIEWVTQLTHSDAILGVMEDENGERGGGGLSCSVISLLKSTRRDLVRYDESNISLLTDTLPEAVSAHAIALNVT